MSDAHETRLVDDGGSMYELAAVGVVAGSFAAFALAAGTLFDWVPLAASVGGTPAATLFGAGVLALGASTVGLGAASRWGGVETTPDRSARLVVGLAAALLWGCLAGSVAVHTLGLGSVGWLAALPVGGLAGFVAVAAREDVGATLPAGAFVCVVGLVVLTGVVTPAWTFEPSGFSATLPGTLVIPLSTMLAALLTGWASASAHEGFGTRGRQQGAFLLVSLVVVLVLSVLAFLLVFVFERGVGVVAENLIVGAGTLLVLVLGALGLTARGGRLQPATSDGAGKVAALVSLAVATAFALVAAALAATIATGTTLSGYAVTVEPTATVGAVPTLAVAGGALLAVRQSAPAWQPETAAARRVEDAFRLGVGLLGATALVEVATQTQLAAAGVAGVPTLAFMVGASALALAGLRAVADFGGSETSAWLPPARRSATVGLWAVVAVCVHVLATGHPVGTGTLGVVGGGTVDWPFVTNPSQGLGIQKGVMPALLGTVWIVAGAVAFAVPLAVGAAVYLTEYADDSLFTRAVDVATNGLWSTPSIVFGLFGLAFLVPRFGGSPSIFAAQLVLGFMLLPLVLITSREAMKSVPDEYRDASAALGVSKWETIRSVVVPAAVPGVATGVILGVGRIAGETAPLLLVLNGPNFPNAAPGVLAGFTVELTASPPFLHVANPALLERASALPYQLYAIITAGVGAEEPFGWGTTLVLIGVVLAFFGIGVATRRYFRHKLHQ